MKLCHPIATALFAVFALVNPTGGTPMPPIENFDAWDGLPEVRGNFDHAVSRRAVGNPLAGTPTDSSAARIMDPETVWRWTPVWHRDGAGGVRLPWVAASPDQSVLAVAESIGDPAGPNATLVVLFNQYTGKIGRVLPLENRKITRAAWLADGVTLIAAEAAQPKRKTPARLLVLDPAAGKVLRESPPLDWDVDALAVAPDGSIRIAGNQRLYRVDGDNWQREEIATLAPGPVALAATADGIYAADRDGMRRLAPDGSVLEQWSWNAPWEVAELVPGASDSLLVIGADEHAKLLSGGALTDREMPVLAAVWLPKAKSFAIAWRQKQAIELIDAEGAPTDVKGRVNAGTALALIPLPGGDFTLITVTGELQRLTANRHSIRSIEFY